MSNMAKLVGVETRPVINNKGSKYVCIPKEWIGDDIIAFKLIRQEDGKILLEPVAR